MHDEKWAKLFYGDSDSMKLWEERRVFGNVTKSNHEFILYCVAMIKWGKNFVSDNKKNSIFNQLEKVYVDNTKDYTYEQFEKLISEINALGNIYRKFIIDFQKSLENSETIPHLAFSNHVLRLLLILEKFGVQMFYPYVIKRISDCNEDLKRSELINDFKILESFVVRRRLSGRGVNDYAEKCNKMLHGEDVRAVLIPELISNESDMNDIMIKSWIKNIKNNETAKILLYCVELYRRDDSRHDIKDLCYNYTLEHVMPVKWDKYWSSVPVLDEQGQEMDIDNPDRIGERTKAISNLGNMILLTGKLNSALNNREFSAKVNGDGKHSGYSEYGSLLLTKEVVDIYPNAWNEATIKDRSEKMFKDILNIWPDYYSELPENMVSLYTHTKSADELCETDPDLNAYTYEQFNDATKMLDAVN